MSSSLPSLPRWDILYLAAAFAVVAPYASGQEKPDPSRPGPGLKGAVTEHLKLAVPPAFDLAHVQPAPFAAALGKDPDRIFEFVRDHVAFEGYAGCLRGPRGTLLAMAGNAPDRALLLASLLEHAGFKVRFAEGKLPEPLARDLLLSMWSKRPRKPLAFQKGDAVKVAEDRFLAGVKRDFELLVDNLRDKTRPRGEVPASAAAGASAKQFQEMVREAQSHCWVQRQVNGKWVDLDPSFADAVPGKTGATLRQVSPALSEKLFHQVEVRLFVKEHGVFLKEDQVEKETTRLLLTYKARAAALSGQDLVLVHVPEKWSGPVKDVAGGLKAALENSGKIKPVLIVGQKKWEAGAPFRPKAAAAGGFGGIGSLLGGEGVRSPMPIAVAQVIEIDLLHPGGSTTTVTRDLFDIVGPARRQEKKTLAAKDLRGGLEALGINPLQDTYSIYVTTGALAAAHAPPAQALPETSSFDDALRGLNILLVRTGDTLLDQVASDKDGVRFYPDTPRVHIADFALRNGKPRLSLDLRQDKVRAASLEKSGHPFWHNVLRGVTAANLERLLLETDMNAAAQADTKEADKKVAAGKDVAEKWRSPLTTSLVTELAQKQGTPFLVCRKELPAQFDKVAADARTRLRADLNGDAVVIVPQRAVVVDGQPRIAWWRVDPSSGETVAVTDEGLHGAVLSLKVSPMKALPLALGGAPERVNVETTVVSMETAIGTVFRIQVMQIGATTGRIYLKYLTGHFLNSALASAAAANLAQQLSSLMKW